ncbi:hypothetical protein KAT80_02200 [Candidatus Pacearchaeota archaeon]|nr:hypothetical protein [Candidatus Pacearchaeota archaeon]
MANLEVGDIVMCTVDRIVGTIVFVKIDGNGEGGIILSEIAPGRIRNLREYVVPKKRIVCKILRIFQNRIDLSLRRVTQKEQKEIKEQYKQEKSYTSILKSVLGEKADKLVKEILKQGKIYEFLQEAKQNSKKLEKLVGKKDSKKILKIIDSQKQKKAIIKKEISLTTTKPNGLELIKNIFKDIANAEIKYISAGRYALQTESTDIKTADKNLKEILKDIEKKAKNNSIEFNIKEK